MTIQLSAVEWAESIHAPPCEAAGHGRDHVRHDHGAAVWYVRNLHGCWGPTGELVAVCGRMGYWITAHRDALGRCPVCGETRYLEDWAYVVRKILP